MAKSSFKKLAGSIIELEVVLDQKEFQEYWQDAYNQGFNKVELKGFRAGAAPKELADQAVDKEKVFHEAVTEAVHISLDKITKENNWTIINKPKIEVDEHKLGLKYKATITVFPEINLGNYKKIAKKIFGETVVRLKEIKVEPAEIEKALDWLRQSRKQGDKIPELNDKFAKSLGDFKTVEDLRQDIERGLIMEKKFQEKNRQRIRVLDEIIKDSKIEIPDIMVEKTLDQMAGSFGDDPAKADAKKEFRDKFRDKAKNNVAANLVLYKIAELEKIENDPKSGLDNEKVFQYLESLAEN